MSFCDPIIGTFIPNCVTTADTFQSLRSNALFPLLTHSSSSDFLNFHSGKQCNPGRIAKSLLVGSAPKPLKTRACALWLCRIPTSFDLLASPEKQKRKAPVPVMLLRTASDTGALLSFWVLFPSEIFLFWQVVPFQNIKIILDVIQCCKLRFQSFESGIISFCLRFKRLVFGG